jgi:hypothetical protein
VQDRPTIEELVDAVRGFLEKDAIPALDGTAKFHARVAANVLAIVGRELALEPAHLTAEWRRLDALLGSEAMPAGSPALRAAVRARTERLCERIRAGDADDGAWRQAVLGHVRATVREKLEIANPKMIDGGRATGDGS